MSVVEDVKYLRQALELARKSPLMPTNYRVGAVLVSSPDGRSPEIMSTGYTMELPGNTHAEECAITKLASQHTIPEAQLHTVLTEEMNATLYTTLEPCGKRLSGNLPCVNRIITTCEDPSERQNPWNRKGGIRMVVFGAKEPGTFVVNSESCRMMDEAGLEWRYVEALQDEILEVANSGHKSANRGTSFEDIDAEEGGWQEKVPRNPKKRMMEVPTRP